MPLTERQGHGSCVFCKWMKDLEGFRKDEEGSRRWITQNEGFIVVLAKHPKVTGHTLVISKRPYNDITEVTGSDAENLGRILVETSKLLKERLQAGKIYVMSMCEHWEPVEIDPQWKEGQKPPSTTEHLHFHLLPRYDMMRTKEIAQENMFVRPEDYGCTLEMLNTIRKSLVQNAKKIEGEK